VSRQGKKKGKVEPSFWMAVGEQELKGKGYTRNRAKIADANKRDKLGQVSKSVWNSMCGRV